MKHFITLSALLFVSLTALCQLVIDNGNILTSREKSEITEKLIDLEAKTSVEILVYTTTDLEGKSPVEYGKELSLKYPTGKEGVNNGAIVLISKNDRKVQILVGYGLEWILNDKETQIIVDKMIPYFKKSNYYNAIDIAIDEIDKKVSSVDWQILREYELPEKVNGAIFRVEYSNNTGITDYKYAIDTDPQFSEDFKITLIVDGRDYDLYYTKYMNDLISTLLTANNVTVFFRLKDYDNKELELIGIK